jgi:hypothetical protein
MARVLNHALGTDGTGAEPLLSCGFIGQRPLAHHPAKVIISRMPMVAARAKGMWGFVGTPWAVGVAIVADSLDSQPLILADQVQSGEE